ncbi:Ras guanine nucleotide exchange factor [Metarhizium album ARSEF 1941]|uniref:Ras guanine nucleotide exchange factor n=1 Tax=Metarhizium album (strain ARSEF 1941) TaxID=1081103 RepID=A0A0B2X7V3_METAS|nr:Ras guanine nucleotide exchange factor [Metarhizium album ARSEF 1941]KHO01823.1 Ras guanine nucleotide exchange factor [Metarhizium album ARSEF 1941]
MDAADPPALTRPLKPGLAALTSLRRAHSRTQTSPKRLAGNDTTTAPSPQVPSSSAKENYSVLQPVTTKWTAKNITRGGSTTSKPLVPFSERRTQQEKRQAETEADRWDIAPDGGSAGREGRQFTVSNVGNNGRIYLRPSIRPAHLRYPQPNFTFPITPPSTAVVDSWNPVGQQDHTKDGEDGESNFPSPWTPTTSATPLAGDRQTLADAGTPSRPRRHHRAMSDSTVHEVNHSSEQEPRTLKVSTSKLGECDDPRPRTMDDLDAMTGKPILDVNIPSWRLGTPRFSVRGTPMIRGSSYAPTEDLRSSAMSDHSPSSQSRKEPTPAIPTRKPSPLAVPGHRSPSVAKRGAPGLPSPRISRPARPTFMSTHLAIEPAMFTDLTLEPARDDGSTVRYSPAGAVTAATPPRLVAEITSPCFLDYELISDFFLTFRSFLEPTDLLQMLIARMRWALDRNDEIGMIVRVRTFVALRHWILNYFVDDFLTDYGLRVVFCNLLNDFVDELCQDVDSRRVQLKILAELKKCWRRVCAQYWDGAEFDDLPGVEATITPGGMVGSRDPGLNPSALEAQMMGQQQTLPPTTLQPKQTSPYPHAVSLPGEIPKAMQVGDFVVLDNRPGTPENRMRGSMDLEHGPNSPRSPASVDVVSCSFPSKSMRACNPNATELMAAHPVPSASVGVASGPIATAPKALVGKRVRPAQTHKRSNSLSDSLRDHGSDKASSTDQEAHTIAPSKGSLVRGNFLPPGQAFVDVESHHRYGDSHRQTTIFQSKSHDHPKERAPGGAMSGYGMRKLLRGVRKALKAKDQGPHSAKLVADIPTVGPRGATTNRIPGTAVVPQQLARHNGARPPVRIDLLGAEVAEDFKKAIREEEEALAAAVDRKQPSGASFQPPNPSPMLSTCPDYPAARMNTSTTLDAFTLNQKQRPVSDMGTTVGSKSIVIVDDTVPFEMPSGAYGSENYSVDAFADSFIHRGTDPTPPNTPPEQSQAAGISRRSSCLVHPDVARPPLVGENILPPFIPDLATLEGSQSARVSEEQARPSLSAVRKSRQHPPLSRGVVRLRRRTRSSKIHQSLDSIMHRRATSFGSVSISHTTESFDATATATSDLDSVWQSQASVPAPLRVLRRRPGGDLKAATKVGDLDRSMVRRSQSVGSLATFSESMRSSYMLSTRPNSSGELDHPNAPLTSGEEVFSLGQLAEKPSKRKLSLFSTHSSKPVMRPSFEAEAQKLAQIPDEEDGGIESALMKLEGIIPKRSPKVSVIGQRPDVTNTETKGEGQPEDVAELNNTKLDAENTDEEKGMNSTESYSQYHLADEAEHWQRVPVEQQPRKADGTTGAPISFLSEVSQESYCSIPLLKRGLGDDTSKMSPRTWTDRSVLRGSDDEDSVSNAEHVSNAHDATHSSFEVVEKSDSIDRIKPGETMPSTTSGMEGESFLRDDSADNTDLSSELSEDERGSRGVKGHANPLSDGSLPAHPLAQEPPCNQRPKTASGQVTRAQGMSVTTKAPDADHTNFNTWPRKPLPPTPDLTPIVGSPDSPPFADEMARSNALAGDAKPGTSASPKLAVHLPFILAFDSDTLAQQFTLIEKDALNEIDWKELIDMDWKNGARGHSRSWVDFLKNTDAQGVEVVIARFNIMVKWAISEIVLTQHVEERARCIIKLIHVAAHCRRYRNFATLAQLTIALSSNEISRMSKTWDLVPASDLKTLSDLELLVTPRRNFHKIRQEMELGSDSGCIPFVGIYTHDLLYNAQKPSEIASSPTAAPLVNFERCRIAASVVKTLLRLLEASTRYTFQPIEGVTERCLWIGALSDEDIRKHSKSLE